MAFDTENVENQMKKKMAKALGNTATPKNDDKKLTIEIPTNVTAKSERVKNYTMTFKPSVRKKMHVLATKHNYNSDSGFITDLVEKMYDAEMK